MRFDRYSSWLPEQGNPGTGPYAVANIYPETHGFPTYSAWSPRLSFIYDLTGNGRVALKASYGRYAAAGSGPTASSGPTAADVNPAAMTTSTLSLERPDSLHAQPGRSAVGDRRTWRLAASIRIWKPRGMDEYTGGVDFGLSRNLTLRLNVVRKLDWGGSKELDLAQPFEAYTDARTSIDPGRDNIAGTADDGTVTVWSVPRTYPTFGQVHPSDDEHGAGRRRGQILGLREHGQQALREWVVVPRVVFHRSPRREKHQPRAIRTKRVPRAVNNWRPDDEFNPELPQTFQGVRLSGTYELPWRMLLASTFTGQQGEYFPRIVQAPNALNHSSKSSSRVRPAVTTGSSWWICASRRRFR